MSAQADTLGRLPRFLHFVRRWSFRSLIIIALANLAWDLWSWQDRSFADGDRRYFGDAERGDEIDYGLAEIRIINETSREFLIDSFVLDGWGGLTRGDPTNDAGSGQPVNLAASRRSSATSTIWSAMIGLSCGKAQKEQPA